MPIFKYCPLCAHSLSTGFFYGRERQYCPRCNFIHYENPLPATVALAELDNKILLIKRGLKPLKGIWTLPSGFMELGESPEECCLRELKEETGMEGTIQKLINAYHTKSNIYGDIVNLIYHIKLKPGTPQAGDDADDAALVPVEKIEDLGFKSFNQAFSIYKTGTQGQV